MKFATVFAATLATVVLARPAVESFDERADLAGLDERDFDNTDLYARDPEGDDGGNLENPEQFASLLNALDQIPDDTLEAGPDAVNYWLSSHGVETLDPNGPTVDTSGNDGGDEGAKRRSLLALRSVFERDADALADAHIDNYLEARAAMELAVRGWGIPKWLKCVWAIAKALPAGKILKIKKIAEKVGGLSKLAKLIVKCGGNRNCVLRNGGTALKEVLDIFTNYREIKKECF